jgi:hypothetical protein
MEEIYKKTFLTDTGTVIYSPSRKIFMVRIVVEKAAAGELMVHGNIGMGPLEGVEQPFNIVLLSYCPVCNKSYKAEILDIARTSAIDYVARAWVPWKEYILKCGVCAH